MESINQEQLFKMIAGLKFRTQSLAGYVQNDFNLMLSDGTINKDDLSNAIIDMQNDFDDVIEQLNLYKNQCYSLMSYYLDILEC